MQTSLMSRLGLGGPVLMSSVGRQTMTNLNQHRCPFLRAAQSLSTPAIPALVQQFKNYCPFLKTQAAGITTMAASPQAEAAAACTEPARSFSAQPQMMRQQSEVEGQAATREAPQAAKAPKISLVPRAEGEALATPENSEAILAEKIGQLKKEGRYRVFFDIERQRGSYPKALRHSAELVNPDEVISFCSNDYLSMGQHPEVLGAMKQVLDDCGAGAGGTRNISGTTPHHSRLETEIASLHSKESSLVFTSCFVANDSSISTLAKMLPNCQIFSDADNHASLIEGVRHSGCQKHIFRHNDVGHLEELMAKCDPNAPKLIIFESVYSMDGDIAPIKEICDVADKYNALTFCDEVHAVGLYGDSGGGVAQQRGIDHRLTLISGTLAKGYGVFGGYIAGSALMIDAVRSFAPGFIFTSSLPPAVAAGACASIKYLKRSKQERVEHQERSQQLKDLLAAAELPYMHSESHIVPVMVRDPELCKAASDLLLNKHKIYVQPINFPTVPRGTERLRFTPGPRHTVEMLEHLVQSLDSVFEELGIDKKAIAIN